MTSREPTKLGRNELCLCGSGVKYKKCCLTRKPLERREVQHQRVQNRFKEKINQHNPNVIVLDADTQPIKMSEIILEFAEDMLRHTDNNTEIRKAIDLACLAWNLAIFRGRNMAEYELQLNLFLDQAKIKATKERDYLILMIDALVDKKMQFYGDIDRLIMDYQISFVGGEARLNVASTIPAMAD